MQYPNVLVRSKTYLSNTVNLPTQIDSSTISDVLCSPESLKKENHIFCCCFFPDSTYSDFFFSCFTMLLLKAFGLLLISPFFRLSCTIWYVCWLVILELNLQACYSSCDILFLLTSFLPGPDTFYEALSYSTGIHIWYNQNSISYLIFLQSFKLKSFLLCDAGSCCNFFFFF